MKEEAIRAKFGDAYVADERTFRMGIDRRFTRLMAERFPFSKVLETCSGGGFSTIALAQVAGHVLSVEIDGRHQAQAKENVARAGLLEKVTFLLGDVLDSATLMGHLPVDAAFLDPDWAVRGPGHTYRFLGSNTEPPADRLLEWTLSLTPNVGLVLPPLVDPREYEGLPPHERQEMHLQGSHELTCLYFGDLARCHGVTEYHVE
jgi:hypothetical protein